MGEAVMEELRSVDEVAYVRFASVYRDFQDVSEFQEEIERMADIDMMAANAVVRGWVDDWNTLTQIVEKTKTVTGSMTPMPAVTANTRVAEFPQRNAASRHVNAVCSIRKSAI